MAVSRILSSASDKRKDIHRNAIMGITGLFPFEEGGISIEATNFKIDSKEYTLNDVKRAILQGASLTEPLTGTLTIKKNGQAVYNKNNYLFMRIPYLTPQHTFVIEGNSYMVGNQLRTKSGIYARLRRNDVPEVSFNLAQGANFKVTMNAETLVFNMEYGGSKSALYPVIKALGFPDQDIKRMWGAKVYSSNRAVSDSASTQVIEKLYSKLIRHKDKVENPTAKDMHDGLQKYFSNTQLDPETTRVTMGMGFRNVNGLALAAAGKKLLDLIKQDVEVDDRDSLQFQKIHSIDSFIRERLEKGGKEVINKIKFRVKNMKDAGDFTKVVPVAPFSKTLKSMVTQFTLSRTPDQINPIEILDGVMKVTRMGEGGIGSLRAVPNETRELHASHLGVLDPVRTPESHNIGVDLRATIRMAKDDDGNIYTPVKRPGSNKLEHINVSDFKNKYLAFPGQKLEGKVSAVYNNKLVKVPASKVDYQIPHYQDMMGPSSTLIPFINSMQGNRALMASKQLTQALPLKYREEPLVQVGAPPETGHKSMHDVIGEQFIQRAPEDGKITKVDDDYIHFKGVSGTKHKLMYAQDMPYNSKTYLNEEVVAPLGKRIKKGDLITDSNYTKNGAMSLGINAKVAYVPYYGINSNDGLVISDSASKKFTSLHMYKEQIDIDKSTLLDKKYWIHSFGNKLAPGKENNYDENGVAKRGVSIEYGDPVILALRKTSPSQTDVILGKLDRSLRNPYRDAAVIWTKENPGVVADTFTSSTNVIVTLKMEAQAVEGDKLSGIHGNKGIISKIVPDDQMLQDASGQPIDVLLTSAGVATRINPSQILETATGKAAKAMGKAIIIDSFDREDQVKKAKELMQKAGVVDKENITDPMTGRIIPNIFVGNQYMAKLFKTTDTNFAARNIGGYSIDEQPTKGGKESASRVGGMELNALLAHGATGVVAEVAGLKSQKNDEWWQAYQRGMPTPSVKRPFIVNKFLGMLNGAQVKVTEDKDKLMFSPLTDKETRKQSNGIITKSSVLRSKDLKPEQGGLFDPVITGGIEGEKWAHIELDEPIVKPMYRKAAASLLGVSSTELDKQVYNKGGAFVNKWLGELNLGFLKSKARNTIENGKGQELNKAIKQHKYIDALEKVGLNPAEAYMGTTLPVVPPKMRPIVPGPNDTLLVADANHLYRDTILASSKLKEMKEIGMPNSELATMREELHKSVGAVVGLNDPVSRKLQQQDKKGFIKKIAGSKPSEGMFQRKVIGRSQDISGRGTIGPDPSLGVDEIGLPKDTAFGIFKPMVIKNLVSKGYPAMDALKHIEDKTDTALGALKQEMNNRPIIYNRAPTLHKGNMISAYASLVPGKTIRINPYSESALNADFDGDTVQLHVPVTLKAQQDASKMLLSNNTFGDLNRNQLWVKPQHEAIIGIHDVLSQKPSGNTFKFKDLAEAKQAYISGTIKANDNVEFTG